MPTLSIPSPTRAQEIEWTDPETFHEALDLHMRRYGDTSLALHKAIIRPGEDFTTNTLRTWRRGIRAPRWDSSIAMLNRIERRYGLRDGYFRSMLKLRPSSARRQILLSANPKYWSSLDWHLPTDFDQRPASQQREILNWVRERVLAGGTEYRLYLKRANAQPYSIRFSKLVGPRRTSRSPIENPLAPPSGRAGVSEAPDLLSRQMQSLIKFKTSVLEERGFRRTMSWSKDTAHLKISHCGLMFGALHTAQDSAVAGRGVALEKLTFGLLLFPKVWDWYLQWRHDRRGFYAMWEVDMLEFGQGLARQETGWIRQHPEIARSLVPISGLISKREIRKVRRNWNTACDAVHRHVVRRATEIRRIARVHRDPFEPILSVLSSEKPLNEYRKIADEILKLKPDNQREPIAAAEAMRAYMMMRVAMHSGLRSRNLCQLLVCIKGKKHSTERQLEDARVGELRWDDQDKGWEIFAPIAAFKNFHSTFFSSKPFRLLLPDLADLYSAIEEYIGRHRTALLGNTPDPGTFFVKTIRPYCNTPAYTDRAFYTAWRTITANYGLYNPYTGRGAIEGLLPHGPNSVRDVLATHIVKQTGSFELASYAIQDTPEVVAKHYARFLPRDKTAQAAKILNEAWQSEIQEAGHGFS